MQGQGRKIFYVDLEIYLSKIKYSLFNNLLWLTIVLWR